MGSYLVICLVFFFFFWGGGGVGVVWQNNNIAQIIVFGKFCGPEKGL